ncbi:MAG: hypothetical protein U0934_16500 [Pseudotabrizicola sp.]|uniref:hypothetical protein n=1 Tax=Pseudotabrizicola sp. TaxID=2939647 RepID=UPI00271FD676|nr:hypothetical protein [Pseudotabrizicola sp.]MDO8882496.1 hypothetical protein [Pseudotabrizicola sp.]MDP2080084.1 hypothetical protein [Pseudotabrizicola sp.]MDZ7575530.1 hypothetical protein [Pseudotabrizicola sp.]
MAFEFFAAIVAAVALGGMAHLLRRLTGYSLPKWFVTVAAAVGLIGTTIYLEYDWFNRVSAELPAGVEVVWQAEEVMTLRPWTMIAPITTRFVAMDTRAIVQHPTNADLRMAKLFNFGRWRPVTNALMAFDCAGRRQVLLTEGAEISNDGILQGAEWVNAPDGDGFQAAACKTA